VHLRLCQRPFNLLKEPRGRQGNIVAGQKRQFKPFQRFNRFALFKPFSEKLFSSVPVVCNSPFPAPKNASRANRDGAKRVGIATDIDCVGGSSDDAKANFCVAKAVER
jgi:hypothetical protein